MVLPNQLTVLRIILSPVFLVLFLQEEPLYKHIALAVFIVAALTDWYDGWLARKFNYITEWGKFVDPLADKILTSTVFIGFVIIELIPLWMVLLIIIRDFVITGLRLYADYKGKSFITSYYAKWKTFLQMFFLYYILILYTSRFLEFIYSNFGSIINALLNEDFIYYGMLVVTLVTVHTGILYLIRNKHLFRTKE